VTWAWQLVCPEAGTGGRQLYRHAGPRAAEQFYSEALWAVVALKMPARLPCVDRARQWQQRTVAFGLRDTGQGCRWRRPGLVCRAGAMPPAAVWISWSPDQRRSPQMSRQRPRHGARRPPADGSVWLFSSSEAHRQSGGELRRPVLEQAKAVVTHSRIAQARAQGRVSAVVCESRPTPGPP